MLTIKIISLFPSYFDSPLRQGILGKAIQSKLLKVQFINPRDYAERAYQNIDDSPFGGADGMLMQYLPMKKTMESMSLKNSLVYYLSPQGKLWDYKQARSWAEQDSKERILICGRYSGLDQRFINEYVDEEISIGDYVLNGGESAALVILDSIVRFIKGALGNEHSAEKESFENQNLLEPPQWTKPRDIVGYQIPKVILSGHHENIRKFQYHLSLVVTSLKRPDLLKKSGAKQDLKEAIQSIQALSPAELKACGLSPEKLQFLIDPISTE